MTVTSSRIACYVARNGDGEIQFERSGPPRFASIMTYCCNAILLLTIMLFLYVPDNGTIWEVFWRVAVVMLLGEAVIYSDAHSTVPPRRFRT